MRLRTDLLRLSERRTLIKTVERKKHLIADQDRAAAGPMRSLPSHGRNTSGTTTEPSAC